MRGAPSALPLADSVSAKVVRDCKVAHGGGNPWEAPEPRPASATPQQGSKRKRHDKIGRVCFLKDPTDMVWPPCAVVVSGKEMRLPPRLGASPKYVQVTPLCGLAPMPEWRHIDETESLQEAVPRLFKLYEERKDVPLLRALLEAVATQEKNSEQGDAESMWSMWVPKMSLAEARAHAGAETK